MSGSVPVPRDEIDSHLAQELDSLSRARIAIVSRDRLLAKTLSQQAGADLQAAPALTMARGDVILNGESFRFRRVVQLGRCELLRPQLDRRAVGASDETDPRVVHPDRHRCRTIGPCGQLLAGAIADHSDRPPVGCPGAHG